MSAIPVHDDTRHVGIGGGNHPTHGVTGNNGTYGTNAGTAIGHNGYGSDTGHYGGGEFDGGRATVFLRPMAAPSALGNAALAGGLFIFSSYIAHWWGGNPSIFSLFILFWGGLAQFIAGIKCYPARDTLGTVLYTLWGSFFMSWGLYALLNATGVLPDHGLRSDWNDLGSWAVVLMIFTYVCAYGALARDWVYFGQLLMLAFGTTLAVGGWYGNSGSTIKAASYFWLVAAALAAYRSAVYIWEENHGPSKLHPLFRTARERAAPMMEAGHGEPGVKRAMPAWQNRADRALGAASRVGGKNSRYSTETGTTRV